MPFTFTPQSVALSRPGLVIGVFRHDPANSAGPFTYLPNVLCLGCQYREGPEPPVARFRYSFDERPADGRPLQFEDVFPLNTAGRLIVENDDRLAVLYFLPDGSSGIVFDGLASVPQTDVSPDGQQVTFVAFSVAVREWDDPISGTAFGAVYRDSSAPTDATANISTDLPVRFNPEGRPNATPEGADATAGPDEALEHPVFLDPNTVGDDGPRYWTLDLAVRYLIGMAHSLDPEWTAWPDADAWTPFLQAWEPAEGRNFDPADPATYDKHDILVSDLDVSGEPWPAAMAKLVEPHNIGMCWRLGIRDGEPTTFLDLFRKDAPVGVKSLLFQPAGRTLDPAATNVGMLNLTRDVAGLATEVAVLCGPTRYEVTVTLTPGFTVAAGDASTLTKWDRNNANFDPTRYRRFIFAEDGAPHWDFATSALVTTVVNLDTILADPASTEEPADQYAKRPRPGLNTLVSVDSEGKPRKAELWISTDYNATTGAGNWQKVSGGWKLLEDRIGVELTVKDVEDWNVGKSDDANAPYGKDGKVRVVTALANPDVGVNKRFTLRLTCVIEGDRSIQAVAQDRFVGPTSYTIRRTVDCRDRFRKEIVHTSSTFNTTGADVVSRDDTDSALALAYAQQRATELAKFGGSVTIPRVTFAYRVGDKVAGIRGRDVDFNATVGLDQGEGATYPTIVAIDWDFEGGQSTTLHLSDERSRPERPRRRGGRRR